VTSASQLRFRQAFKPLKLQSVETTYSQPSRSSPRSGGLESFAPLWNQSCRMTFMRTSWTSPLENLQSLSLLRFTSSTFSCSSEHLLQHLVENLTRAHFAMGSLPRSTPLWIIFHSLQLLSSMAKTTLLLLSL
jgi:hypothetical protein